MMKKVFKGLEVNQKDNLATALSKGMVEGAIDGLVGSLVIAGVIYTIGKSKQVNEIQEKAAE